MPPELTYTHCVYVCQMRFVVNFGWPFSAVLEVSMQAATMVVVWCAKLGGFIAARVTVTGTDEQ